MRLTGQFYLCYLKEVYLRLFKNIREIHLGVPHNDKLTESK